MIEYAAHDAHYLIYISQEMLRELIQNEDIKNVMQEINKKSNDILY